MSMAFARTAYRQTEAQGPIHPVKLVHMMYERILVHLEEAEAGILQNSPLRRGENIGKAIALITELYASIKEGDESDASQFLRGLYQAIMMELPKVAVNNDPGIVRRAHSYINKLKEIWEQTAMRENGLLNEMAVVRKQGMDKREVRTESAAAISLSI